MKTIIFFACVFLTSFSFSQKVMTSKVEKFQDEFGSIDALDSTVYHHSSWEGYFYEFKPKFGYESDIMYYFIEDFIVHCDSVDDYSFPGALPLVLNGTTRNTLLAGYVNEAEFSGGFNRVLYTYDAQNLKLSETTQYLNTGIWLTLDSTAYSYDVNGNLITELEYYYSGGVGTLSNVDSLWYQAGTNLLIKATNYYDNGSNLILNFQTIVSYIGTEVETVDLYEGDGSGGLDWYYSLSYLYTVGVLNGFDAFEVINNVPNTIPDIVGAFEYTGQNEIEAYSLIMDGDTLGKTVFTYDDDGYVTQVEELGGGDFGLYPYYIKNYYFASVASTVIEEPIELVVFPNPTSDFLTLQTNENIELIQIINMNGQVLLEQNNSAEINVSHLPKGTYIVRGQSANKEFKKVFVKQ